MNNTAGSHALLKAQVSQDSTVAANPRQAGGVILGKTDIAQWAACRGTNSSAGWSAHGGQTVGAYYPNQSPSGSSSGSGVATSIGLVWASLGTETSGSITLPSEVNNIVGIKPTVGLTSRYLVVPISEHQDTVGPMARTVKDAAYLLSAIVGSDPHDNYMSAIPFTKMPDYAAACVNYGLRGKRLGILRYILKDIWAVDILISAGAEIVDDIIPPGFNAEVILKLTSYVLGGDFLVNLETYLSELTWNPQSISTLAQLREWTQQDPREEYPEHNTDAWDMLLARGLRNTGPEFWDIYTRSQHLAGQLGYSGALKNHSLDAIVLPTKFALILPVILGTPVIPVPFGRHPDDTSIVKDEIGNLDILAPNLPFGIVFAGAPFSEEALIGIAHDFEQQAQARKAIVPFIKPVTELGTKVERKQSLLYTLDL
ncbi:putative amidase [Colletotrichum sidae]|uniref:Putative amidase n=1 Tax=Colletotrichum sidae TaxID=1347389 RepID=A0A4R8T2A5_9PEZI|nr:putative amidase [Colletotrichum sidae]